MVDIPAWVASTLISTIRGIKNGGLVAVIAAALCVIAAMDVVSFIDRRQWAAGDEERTQQVVDGFMDRIDSMMADIEERSGSMSAQERSDFARRNLFERLVRNRHLIADCQYVPSHILNDLHEIPMHFTGFPDVLDAYDALVTGNTSRRGRLTEALFQSLARATDSSDRLPPAREFAREFTVGCLRQ